MNTWKLDESQTLNLFVPHDGREIHVWISARPDYCDRGHYQLNVSGIRDLDSQDGFPRYYMSLRTAMLEAEEFLQWRLSGVARGEGGHARAMVAAADGTPSFYF